MLTSDFSYSLPEEFIAQVPAEPRDSSRLMAIDKTKKTVLHRHFYDIAEYLKPGDLLVWNNTKVFKARLFGEIAAGKKVEIFLLRPASSAGKPMENYGVWQALAKPGRKLKAGMEIKIAPDFSARVISKSDDGTVRVQFADNEAAVREKANKYGEVPTPPYIKNPKSEIRNPNLAERYQTVYAKYEGSVAAPTAGFHFTPELIKKLSRKRDPAAPHSGTNAGKQKGVEFAEVTLHVGLGTFLPVKTDKIEEHKMHNEWVKISAENADKINRAKSEGRRVVAVGTTTVRALEGMAECHQGRELGAFSGDINIFITPGFRFRIVDALITNFHLPKSTLLMLVSAFASDKDFILKCYEEAVKEKYRFYSFGDAMLII